MDQIAAMLVSAVVAGLVAALGATVAAKRADKGTIQDVVQVQSDPLPVWQGVSANCGRTELGGAPLMAAYRSFYRSSVGGPILMVDSQARSG
jgi:hypothetical protein